MKERAFREIQSNGIRLRVVVEGQGPLLILLHGFPQGWFLWRHQIDPLVQAGFQVAVPDQRGYGGSDALHAVEAYNLVELCKDVAGIADALGHEKFIVIGHDWGAPVAWNTALLHESRVRAVVGMSVPYFRFPIGGLTRQENFGDQFWYMAYFQTPGVAEREFESDLRGFILRTHWMLSGDAPEGLFFQPKPSTAKFLDGVPEHPPLPGGMSEADLDYIVAQYQRNGTRGPLNWYRNIDRSMQLTPQLEGRKIMQPALFLAGERDVVLKFPGIDPATIFEPVQQLRKAVIVPGAGHWVPAERPDVVNPELLAFLAEFR
jgi:pimeloyl-ACP methyl ester carboxylesterase